MTSVLFAPDAGGLGSPFDLAPEPSATGPYQSSAEHLWDELRRVDQYVRGQTVRWRMTIAASKPEQLWGMAHVTDAEVAAYLNTAFAPPHELPADLEAILKPSWLSAEDFAKRIRTRRQTTPSGVELRIARLQELFGLSTLAYDALLVCLLAELDARYRRLFGYLQDDVTQSRPTVELVLQILHPIVQHSGEGRAVLDTEAPLLRQQLLIIDHAARGENQPLAMRSLRLDDRIAGYLLGNDSVDSRLVGLVELSPPLDWSGLTVEPEQLDQLQALVPWWQQLIQTRASGAALLLQGGYGSGRLAAARALCTELGLPLLVVDLHRVAQSGHDWRQTVALCLREAALRSAAIFWSNADLYDEQGQTTAHWEVLADAVIRSGRLNLIALHDHWEPTGVFRSHPFLRVEFPAPRYGLRRRLWERHLPEREDFAPPQPERLALAATLANSFQLSEGQVLDAIASARRQATLRTPQEPLLTVEDLYTGCRRQSSPRLASLARRIEPRSKLTFEKLVLPPTNQRQLAELRSRIRHRSRVFTELGFEERLSLGKGLIALFTGSSGTGKTMAAELLASEQGVDLYKVDLSAVVSKYVGETEKNLSKLFAEAEDANAIIFFDEADALFGKRGEVKESRDRWANMEVNYLLQRVEEYAGSVIMASNLRQNIDEAFLRRVHVVVEFPFPNAEARLGILQGLFPAGVQPPGVDELRQVADRFELAGGSLKNVVVDAVFRAVAEDDQPNPPVTLRHLVLAAAREYQKLGKPITKSEFFGTFYQWVTDAVL